MFYLFATILGWSTLRSSMGVKEMSNWAIVSEEELRPLEFFFILSHTAMDFPMDFVNAFADDERTAVRFDNVSDGLLMRLDKS